MKLPNQFPPIQRTQKGLIPQGVLLSGDPCQPCIDICQKAYRNDKVRYAACCQTCGEDISRVCWYQCCSQAPGCTVPS